MDEQDISLEDLEKSEQMLKDSLFKIGHMAGLSNDQLEADWQRIKLEASSRDIHIEEL
jgi:cell division protein FtsL